MVRRFVGDGTVGMARLEFTEAQREALATRVARAPRLARYAGMSGSP
jgi:hypothetical protein